MGAHIHFQYPSFKGLETHCQAMSDLFLVENKSAFAEKKEERTVKCVSFF